MVGNRRRQDVFSEWPVIGPEQAASPDQRYAYVPSRWIRFRIPFSKGTPSGVDWWLQEPSEKTTASDEIIRCVELEKK